MHLNKDQMLRVVGLKKVFRSGESDLVLFENLSFEVQKGEMLAVVGESGAGTSTLLHILGALERASRGDVYCANFQLNSLVEDGAADFRNTEIGFVWQFHYLLPEFTALENAAMPLLMRGRAWQTIQGDALHWLREVGLEQRAHHRAGELSGGEQQRVALARALYRDPFLVVLDEPNSNLDAEGDEALTKAILGVRARGGIAVVIAHRPSAIAGVDYILVMAKGRQQQFGPKDEILARVTQQPSATPRPLKIAEQGGAV